MPVPMPVPMPCHAEQSCTCHAEGVDVREDDGFDGRVYDQAINYEACLDFMLFRTNLLTGNMFWQNCHIPGRLIMGLVQNEFIIRLVW